MKTSLLHGSSSEILHGDDNFQKEEATPKEFLVFGGHSWKDIDYYFKCS